MTRTKSPPIPPGILHPNVLGSWNSCPLLSPPASPPYAIERKKSLLGVGKEITSCAPEISRKESMGVWQLQVFHTQGSDGVRSIFFIVKCDWFNSKFNLNLIFFSQPGISKQRINQTPNYRQHMDQRCWVISCWISPAMHFVPPSSAVREVEG